MGKLGPRVFLVVFGGTDELPVRGYLSRNGRIVGLVSQARWWKNRAAAEKAAFRFTIEVPLYAGHVMVIEKPPAPKVRL